MCIKYNYTKTLENQVEQNCEIFSLYTVVTGWFYYASYLRVNQINRDFTFVNQINLTIVFDECSFKVKVFDRAGWKVHS